MFPLFAVTGFCRKLECTHSRALCSVGGDTWGTLGVFRGERQLPTHQFCLHSSPSRTSPESATGGDLKRWAEQGTHLGPSSPCAPWWEGPWLGPQDSTFRILLSPIHCLLSNQPWDCHSPTSAASNIANAESGFSARTSGLSNSIT